MSTATKIGALVLGVALLHTALPTNAVAQKRSVFSLDGRVGLAIPAGELSQFEGVGFSYGGGLAVWLTRVFGVRGDAQWDLLVGDDLVSGEAPDLDLRHFSGSLVFNFPSPKWQDLPFTFMLEAGAGVTNWKASSINFSESYFTANGGVSLGYQATRNFNFFVAADAYFMSVDEQDTLVWAALDPSISTFTTSWSFPLVGGVMISLP